MLEPGRSLRGDAEQPALWRVLQRRLLWDLGGKRGGLRDGCVVGCLNEWVLAGWMDV